MLKTWSAPAPGMWSEDRPQDGAKGDGSRRYVWELVPEDVIEILAELNSADSGREWRSRKDKMERLSGLWAEFECSQRTIQLRE